MNTTDILSAIDGEVSRLTQARSLLSGLNTTSSSNERVAPRTPSRRGRPNGSKDKATSFNPSKFGQPKRRTMSPEGKARIAAAQRARWARQHGTDAATPASRGSSIRDAARVTSPAKTSAKASPAAKGPTGSKQAGTKASAATKSNPLKKAPAKPVPPSRTAAAVKKTPSKVAVQQNATTKEGTCEEVGQKAGGISDGAPKEGLTQRGSPTNRDADRPIHGFYSLR